AERLEHLGRVPVGLDLRPRPGDPAIWIDQVRRADDAVVGPAERSLLTPRSIALDDLALRIGQQREWQVELLTAAAMARGAVLADTPDVGVGCRVVLVEVPELAGLGVATGRVVLRVEVQDGPATLLVRQMMDHPRLVGERHVGRRLADLRGGPRVG